MSGANELSRRRFLQVGGTAVGGLVLGFNLPLGGRFASAAGEAGAAQVNAWLRITPDNRVTILVSSSEMGQGVYTAMPMLVAEELGVEWSQVRAEIAPANPVYTNRLFGFQGTGGSTSIRQGFDHLRQAGAVAREMLRGAAAERWSVPVGECSAAGGRIRHGKTSRTLTYGELAVDAAKRTPPKHVALKNPKDWSIIGKSMPRLDTPAKTTGSAVFGVDVQRPGMLVGSVRACPTFGGKLVSVDQKPALLLPGVKRVIATESAVIVVADGYWNAHKGLEALEPVWDHGPNAALSSAGIQKQMRAALDAKRSVARSDGDCDEAFRSAATTHEAIFEAPFLAHATMEPMNATADVRPGGVDVWAPTQNQEFTQKGVAWELGIELEQVRVHTTFLGGGFGRRVEFDFIRYAVIASKAAGAPVKVLWSREEDMQHGFYRPASMVRMSAAIDKTGACSAFRAHITSPSIQTRLGMELENGVDDFATEGITGTLYRIPNQQIEYGIVDTGVPVGFWRAVGHSQNAFFMEAFIDELAHEAGKDPLKFRLQLLRDRPRQAAVVSRVAEMSGWGKPLPKGRFRGLASHYSHGSHTAEVAEISIESNRVRVHRVYCAFDCGLVINPDTVEAQLESGIIFGLTAALHGEITLEKGRVQQSNFPDYPMVTPATAPAIEVHVMKSTEAPGGVGEPATPPIAPAVANAVFAATGKRVRKLPIRI